MAWNSQALAWIFFYRMSSILSQKSKVTHAFFHDEYQGESGNLSCIHGLFVLYKDDISSDEYCQHIKSLQSCKVCDSYLKRS